MSISPLHLLAATNLVLAGLLASLWLGENSPTHAESTWQAPLAVNPDIATPTRPIKTATNSGEATAFLDILERPLFAPNRRPPPATVSLAPPPPPPPDPFVSIQLSGLFTGPQGGMLVRVEGKMRRVMVGQSIGAWTLANVQGREATFTQGEQERKLTLQHVKLNAARQTIQEPGATNPTPETSPPTPPTAAQDNTLIQAQQQDKQRERLRSRNELRIQNGLPPLTE